MKKFIQLQQSLKVLEAQKINVGSIEDMSLLEFIKHKSLILRKTKLKSQMKKSLSSAQEIVSNYKIIKEQLLNNNSINCRKYQKLIKRAEYKANLKLYKLGFIKNKPIHPLFQKANQKINRPIFNFFKRLSKNVAYFKSTIIPQKIDKLALQTAKAGIRGYRAFKSNCKLVGKHLSSNECAQRIQGIIQKAKKQLNTEEMMNICSNHSTPNCSFYKASLKFDFPNSSNVIQQSSSQKKSTPIKEPYLELDL